jgi:flagellar biosynthetic protein FlhB
MAEDRDQKTEDATPRKREKMQEEGQVIRSADVGAAAVVAATCLALASSFHLLGNGMLAFARRAFRLVDATHPLEAVRAQLDALMPLVVPLGAASLAAAVVGVAQARVFSLSHLAFKLERLDPMGNLSQLMPTKTALFELLKQIGKLCAIGYIAYRVIADAMPMFTTLSNVPPLAGAAAVIGVAGKLTIRVGGALLVAAAVDYWLARRKFLEDAKMTREEVRDEHKEQEGRPEVRGRIRRKMREMGKNRALADIAKATVVVVNPTHFAVALRYEPEKDFAPVVLAKGVDEFALQMRSQARREGVPVVEQRPLARALYKDGKIGRTIPVDLYRAVAEIIAYVMQLKARDAGVTVPQQGEA